ncbi:hypothetical protein FHL15_001431 [Xylaria flabelliformis]|uniref:Uncharacterized protein n=1 Tax=Xylaria flabelliformis TaxID=2512241 RepID=A0A553IBW0_9PEZI|nr:hypothetical protein FHL15_001431 [Xylaria flabelliformis]
MYVCDWRGLASTAVDYGRSAELVVLEYAWYRTDGRGNCGEATQNVGDIADHRRLSLPLSISLSLRGAFYANRYWEDDKETASEDTTGNRIELTTLASRAKLRENDGDVYQSSIQCNAMKTAASSNSGGVVVLIGPLAVLLIPQLSGSSKEHSTPYTYLRYIVAAPDDFSYAACTTYEGGTLPTSRILDLTTSANGKLLKKGELTKRLTSNLSTESRIYFCVSTYVQQMCVNKDWRYICIQFRNLSKKRNRPRFNVHRGLDPVGAPEPAPPKRLDPATLNQPMVGNKNHSRLPTLFFVSSLGLPLKSRVHLASNYSMTTGQRSRTNPSVNTDLVADDVFTSRHWRLSSTMWLELDSHQLTLD